MEPLLWLTVAALCYGMAYLWAEISIICAKLRELENRK